MDNGSQTRADEPTESDSSLDKKRDIHKQLSAAINRLMTALLIYSIFCINIIFQPDVPLAFKTGIDVKIPVINVAVSLKAFLLVGPLGLILIATYLHLLLSRLDRITGLTENDKQPFLFNFQDRLSRFLRFLIFYAAPPIVMVGFTWKSAVYEWWVLMYFATILVAIRMFLLCRKSNHQSLSAGQQTGNKAKPQSIKGRIRSWFVRVIIFGIFALPGSAILSFGLDDITCGLNLMGAKFTGAEFRMTDLIKANLKHADLSKADLRGAKLSKARLEWAYLYEANLREADLQEADLTHAYLSKADLTYANLSKAVLRFAYFKDANLRDADLSEATLLGARFMGVDLRDANLTVDQICRKAATFYGAKLDPVLEKQIKEECPDQLEKPSWLR
jgi:hypothetical protein